MLGTIAGGRLLKDRAYDALREAILRLVLKPGEPLTERVLSVRLGVSKSPIRDALIRLEQEGLVRSTPFKGFEVAPLSRRGIEQVFEFREAVELYCVELAVTRRSAEQTAALEATHAEQRRLVDAGDPIAAYEQSHFHSLLVRALDNPIFAFADRVIEGQVRRVQNLASNIPGRVAKTYAEHEEILRGIRSADLAGAREAMRAHLRSVLADILESEELLEVSGVPRELER